MNQSISIIISTFSFNHREPYHVGTPISTEPRNTQAPPAPSVETSSAMRKSSSVTKMKRRIIGATVPVPCRQPWEKGQFQP